MLIIHSKRYRKDLKRCILRHYDMNKLNLLIDSILSHQLSSEWECHPLKGNYSRCMDCHVDEDWVLIYQIKNNVLYLERTGTHSDVF